MIVCSFHGPAAHLSEVLFDGGKNTFGLFNDGVSGRQLEYNGLPHLFSAVGCLFIVAAGANHLIDKEEPATKISEKEKILAVKNVAHDGSVASDEGHVTDLTLPKILKSTVWQLPVGVAVGATRFASNNENYAVQRRGNNSALLLAVKPVMDVYAAVVEMTAFKSPRHSAFPIFSTNMLAVLRTCSAGVVKNLRALPGTGGGSTAQDISEIEFSQ